MDYLASLHLIRDIGKGSFGLVRLCTDEVHGDVAAKFFFKASFPKLADWQAACDKALKEAKALQALKHRNVVRVHHVLRAPKQDEFLLVMEFCEGGSTKAIAETNKINIKKTMHIIRDAAIGLNYIHNQSFLHRDIKPDNILLDAKSEAKVGDFGFVTDQLVAGFATAYGTPFYLAPEVPNICACSVVSDIYSLGVTFLHLLHGDHWFFRQGRGAFFDIGQLYPTLATKGIWLPHIPATWKRCVARLTHPDPARRCQSMDEAVNLISRLPLVEDWTCIVEADRVSWTLQSAVNSRRVRVEWENYLRFGESWCAWSEDSHGKVKKTLDRSQKGDPQLKTYRGLEAFFSKRQSRQS